MDYTAHTTITMLCWFRKTLPRLLPSASVSGEYVNLLKRFPGMNERIELADEKVVHRVAGKWYSNSRDFSAKCGIAVVDQVIEHLVCRRPVGRLASLAVTHQRRALYPFSHHVHFTQSHKKGPLLHICCHNRLVDSKMSRGVWFYIDLWHVSTKEWERWWVDPQIARSSIIKLKSIIRGYNHEPDKMISKMLSNLYCIFTVWDHWFSPLKNGFLH